MSIVILFLYVVVVVAAFYLLAIRPQRRRRQAQQELISTVKKGDDIVTRDGLCGTVRRVGDDFVVVEIAERKTARFLKTSVTAVVPKGRPAKPRPTKR